MTDLHLHSSASDGELSPQNLVKMMTKKGYNVISLTDHDTVEGLDEANAEALKHKMIFVNGIELSSFLNYEIHILGYNVPYKNSDFLNRLKQIAANREERNLIIVKKLNALNIPINYDKIKRDYPHSVIGRKHIAQALKDMGVVSSVYDAFEQFLGTGKKAHAVHKKLTTVQAVNLIASFGAQPVLAHPGRIKASFSQMCRLVEELKDAGLKGIEANYASHTIIEQQNALKLADKFNLFVTCGSDFHGTNYMSELFPKELDLDDCAKKALNIGCV